LNLEEGLLEAANLSSDKNNDESNKNTVLAEQASRWGKLKPAEQRRTVAAGTAKATKCAVKIFNDCNQQVRGVFKPMEMLSRQELACAAPQIIDRRGES
jgi:hypothetical protein